MGEVSHVKAGVPKPRPLGLVKRESIHFEDVEGKNAGGQSLPEIPGGPGDLQATFYFQGRSKTDVDFRQELKSMRDLQETLRQAALLNIVAAVNNEGRLSDGTMPTTAVPSRTGPSHHHTSGIRGANVLGHSMPGPESNSKLVLTHGSTALPGGAFSRHLHTATTTAAAAPPSNHYNNSNNNNNNNNNNNHIPTTPAAPPNTALSQLLSQRPRAISIPRPRTHGEPSSFMHSSLLDAKDQLANMTNFRGARTKHENGSDPLISALAHAQYDSPAATFGESKPSEKHEGHATHAGGHQLTARAGDAAIKGLDFSSNRYALRGTGYEVSYHNVTAEGAGVGKTGGHDDSGVHNGLSDQNGGVSKLSKEEQRAHNVHQMQMLKRHISTSKKRELVKKLTDIAKCEAVDMSEAMEAENSGPMIILAHSKTRSRPDYDSPDLPDSTNLLKRTKSTSSIHEKSETCRVPSNTRVQSETLESMMTYREAKRAGSVNPADDLRIEGTNNPEGSVSDGQSRVADLPHETFVPLEMYQYPDFSSWVKEQRLNGYTSRHNNNNNNNNHYSSSTPEALELRPLATSPLQLNHRQPVPVDKKRILISRRGVNPVLRDKLASPSPVVYEASYHRPKASIGHISLVGQSLPSLSVSKPSPLTHKPGGRRHTQEEVRTPSRSQRSSQEEELAPPVRLWNDQPDKVPARQTLKPWGSSARQTTSDSPILRTEIVDHLQCVAIVDKRPLISSQKKTLAKVIGSNKADANYDDESVDDFADDDEPGSEVMKSSMYRRSKLYSAFRASEENLANLAEVSSMVSDTCLTTRSLLNQPVSSKPEPALPPPPPSRDPVQHSHSEPRYMGCSSRVSDNEMRSQFHFINDREEAEARQGGNFRVFKALDQDVYFDFQHKKYRNNNNSSTSGSALNTAGNKPRMHFIKIKYSGETKS